MLNDTTTQRVSDLENRISSMQHQIDRLLRAVSSIEHEHRKTSLQELLTVRQVQEVLQISRGMVLKLRQDGRLPFITIGEAVRIPRTAVETIAQQGI